MGVSLGSSVLSGVLATGQVKIQTTVLRYISSGFVGFSE
jgi:hypothetical protein